MLTAKVLFLIVAVFASSSQGVILNCRYAVQVYWWQLQEIYVYHCHVTRIDESDSTTAVTGVQGTHFEGFDFEDVQGLEINNQPEFSQIFTNIEDFFPNLIAMRFENGNLSTISSEDLRPFPNLWRLNVVQQSLTALDGNLFQHNPDLEIISFQHNQITNVGHGLLSGLNRLIWGDFRNNNCVDIFADGPAELESLQSALIYQCPPLAQCPIRCTMNEEVDDLRRQVDEHERRLSELESRLRALGSTP